MPLLYPGNGLSPTTVPYGPWTTTPTVPVPAPISTTTTIVCGGTLGTFVIVRFDSPRVEACQNKNNRPANFEAITLE